MRFKWLILLVMAAGFGVAIREVEARLGERGLEVGKCYILKDAEEFGLKYSFVHMIHRKGHKNMYLSEQWDQAAGWYGFSSVRPFTAGDYSITTCPKGAKL